MSGSTSQPNLNSIVAALQHTPRDTGLDLDGAQRILRLLGAGPRLLRAVRHRAAQPARAEVYLHEMPGGQYTNLKEQAASMGLGASLAGNRPHLRRGQPALRRHRQGHARAARSSATWRCSSFTRGIKPADVVNLEPGTQGFPESVIDMLSGGLGWPAGGWPEEVQRVVLGEKRAAQARKDFKKGVVPGAVAAPANLEKIRKELSETLKREATDDDLYSYLMYPQVFAEFAKHSREFGDVSVLPTPAFFYGLCLARKSLSPSRKARH